MPEECQADTSTVETLHELKIAQADEPLLHHVTGDITWTTASLPR